MKNKTNTNLVICSGLVLASALVIWSPVQALSAEPSEGNMMNHTNGGMGFWPGGGLWVWPVIGVLLAVVLVIVLKKLFKK